MELAPAAVAEAPAAEAEAPAAVAEAPAAEAEAPAAEAEAPAAEAEATKAPTAAAPTAAAPTQAAPMPADAPPKAGVSAETVLNAPPDAERDERVAALLAKAASLDFRRTAESVYREVLKLAPDTVDAHSGLAMVALNRGKNREARKHAEHALSLRNNDGTALIVLGATFTAEGNKEKARAAYQRCAALPGKYAAECKRMLH
jgi:tetratricopeptide (TPR) repeat protein